MKFSPCVSRYRREHAPKKLYLPSDVSIAQMYNDFKESQNFSTSYELYRKVVNEMNISFTRLGHKECEAFTLHNPKHTKVNAIKNKNCDNCENWLQHINRAQMSRNMYKLDKENKDDDTLIYSSDIQKVVMLPRIDMFKQVIFTPRIIAFNQSFVPLGAMTTKNKDVAVIWRERVSGRKKENVISAYNYYVSIHARDKKHICTWADNCSGQNKNWSIFSFLLFTVNNQHIMAETITIKFFEPCHTFMSADSLHHLVEKGLRENPKVYDFQVE